MRAHTPALSLPFGHAAVPFLIRAGPRLGNSPVPSIVQCLARKDGTDDFYQLKVSRQGLARVFMLFFLFLPTATSKVNGSIKKIKKNKTAYLSKQSYNIQGDI